MFKSSSLSLASSSARLVAFSNIYVGNARRDLLVECFHVLRQFAENKVAAVRRPLGFPEGVSLVTPLHALVVHNDDTACYQLMFRSRWLERRGAQSPYPGLHW